VERVARAIDEACIAYSKSRAGLNLRKWDTPGDVMATAAIAALKGAEPVSDDLSARIAELEAENWRLREFIASASNRLNIVGSPYHRAQLALDQMVSDFKDGARQALKGSTDA
jgi:hypothetical protein